MKTLNRKRPDERPFLKRGISMADVRRFDDKDVQRQDRPADAVRS
jgi:hypothetical protein